MEIEFSPPSIEHKFGDAKLLKRKYGDFIAKRIVMFIGALESATSAYDLKCLPQFRFEHKKHNLKEFYSVSLDKKKGKWRLMLQMIDENGKVIVPSENERMFLEGVKRVRIRGMSEHYEEY